MAAPETTPQGGCSDPNISGDHEVESGMRDPAEFKSLWNIQQRLCESGKEEEEEGLYVEASAESEDLADPEVKKKRKL